jgi:hypothetical protein
MRKALIANVLMVFALALMLAAIPPAQASTIILADGTVTANRQDSGTGTSWWWGESVTTVRIDAENLSAGQHVEVSGKITNISDIANTDNWVEIGLIQKGAWDYWQTAYSGNFKSAVFDKGIYVVQWTEATGTGLQLQEGWWSGGGTVTSKGGYAWDLAEPTSGSPWEFTFSMYPTSSGNAYLSVVGEDIYGTEPLVYDGTHNGYSFSDCYLIAQIWSDTENATFSFEDVQATVVPIPASVLLLGSGILGLIGVGRFRFRKRA